jgi:ribosomal protein S18 acetylase RimI-like enzyme
MALFGSKKLVDFSTLVVRQVMKTDLPALEWDGEFLQYRKVFADLYRNMMRGHTLMWMVESALGEMIGQAFIMLKSGEREAADGERRAYLFAFRVKPAWRNQGVGSHLMRVVEDDLRRRGFQYLTLNVAKDNPDALRLYRRLGYRIIGSRPGKWSYKDHEGRVHHVHEPAWRMMRRIAVEGESPRSLG